MAVNFESLQIIGDDIFKYNPLSKLIIVTKNRSESEIKEILDREFNLFGENKVQEANKKYLNFRKTYEFELHMIGPLQTNKTELALQTFDTIQSIDRTKLVDAIVGALSKMGNKIRTQKYYIQINIGEEPQKSGILPDQSKELYEYCLMNHLNIEGLMCIPPAGVSPDQYFEKLIQIRNDLNVNLKLSMGMSADYKIALKKKTDFIRVGSLIFN